MPSQPKFTCPICKQPMFKKQILSQTVSLIGEEEGFKFTRTFKRMGCFACLKTEWKLKDGTILLPLKGAARDE